MKWRLRSEEEVADAATSHLADHAGVEAVLAEALSNVDAEGPDFVATVDLGRPVGLSHCVETGPDDDVFWECRGSDRTWPTRFVRGREPAETSFVTVVLVARKEGGYVLLTAFFGQAAPPEPGDPRATAASEPFWASHALVRHD